MSDLYTIKNVLMTNKIYNLLFMTFVIYEKWNLRKSYYDKCIDEKPYLWQTYYNFCYYVTLVCRVH